MKLDEDDLVSALLGGLVAARDEVELAQARHGIDELRELDLQDVLARGLEAAGFFVAREQRYPGDRIKRQRTSGRRCDLVVTVDGPFLDEHGQPGLFGTTSVAHEAAWLEVKVMKQFGPRGPNHNWQHALLDPPTEDIARLAGDDGLGLRALVVVLFTADEDTAAHDLGVWRQHVLGAGLSVAPAVLRPLSLVDRVGNRCCTLAWLRVSSPTRLG